MITITAERPDGGMIRLFRATGHAGAGPYGQDIVCAAVTAITATVIGGLQENVGLTVDYTLESGLLEIRLPDSADLSDRQCEDAALLLDVLMLGCRQIQANNPGTIRFRRLSR